MMRLMKEGTRSRRGVWAAASILTLTWTLAGCGVDRIATGSIVPENRDQRHPIALVEAPVNLAVFPAGAVGLDAPSYARVREFGAKYRHEGQGRIVILMPAGGANQFDHERALAAIRRALSAGGARGFVSVDSYPVADPNNVAPVRLSFQLLKARVANRCGEWPADLASGSSLETWENRPYWNFGCAYQTEMASQVADPRDLVEPRAEGPSDVAMRTRAISKVREGADPGTNWVVKNTSIGAVGGGS